MIRRSGLVSVLSTVLLALGASVVTAMTPSLAWAQTVSESRPVTAFQRISVAGPLNVTVRQTGREAVMIRADAAVLPKIESLVESGSPASTLVLRVKRGENLSHQTNGKVDIEVEVKDLSSVAIGGSGDVRVEGLSAPTFAGSVAGSGDLRVRRLQSENTTFSVAGSGDVHADGQTTRLKISIAGSGDVRTQDLRADEVEVSIAGSGDADIQAQRTLKVSIAGSGNVTYRGNPEVKKSIAGFGNVTRK